MEKILIQPRSFVKQVTSFCSIFDPSQHTDDHNQKEKENRQELKEDKEKHQEEVKEEAQNIVPAPADVTNIASEETEPIAKALPEFVPHLAMLWNITSNHQLSLRTTNLPNHISYERTRSNPRSMTFLMLRSIVKQQVCLNSPCLLNDTCQKARFPLLIAC